MNTSPRVKKIRKIILEITKLRHKKAWKRDLEGRVPGSLTDEQSLETKKYFSRWCKIEPDFCGFYTAATEKYYPNYIPDDLYYSKIDPYFNDWESAEYIDNKCFYSMMFPNVKHPKMIVMRMNGFWYQENSIVSEAIALELISQNEAFIKQAQDSEGGHGVTYCPQQSSIKEIKKYVDRIKGDLVVQEAIIQHEEMAKLNESSVNTIRVMSLLRLDGRVEIISSIVRMGISGAKVDNASSGGITCGVKSNGQLKDVAFSAKGIKYLSHPDNGLCFSDVTIPKYQEVLELVKECHLRIPHFRLVSWDFCINKENEIVLVESNLKYGELDFHQLNNGPIFGDMTEDIFNEVFNYRN